MFAESNVTSKAQVTTLLLLNKVSVMVSLALFVQY